MSESGRFYCTALRYIGCVLVERSGPLRKQNLRNRVYWFCEDALFYRIVLVNIYVPNVFPYQLEPVIAGIESLLCKEL